MTDLHVSIDFEGGSAAVERIAQSKRVIRFMPSDHPSRGWRVWYYFRVDGIEPGEIITLESGLGDMKWLSQQYLSRAYFSLDDEQWQQTAVGEVADGYIRYQQEVWGHTAWFAWGVPYLPRHARELVTWAERQSPRAHAYELCRSREGRPVPALRISAPEQPATQRFGVWIQAREHAWEASASWVCHHLTRWLLSDDTRAQSLLATADFGIVPIMDVDNVVRGAGGKVQEPRDHARDWLDEPYWPEVAAAQAEIRRMVSADRFDLFLTLHGPSWNAPFFFIPALSELSPLRAANLQRLLHAAEATPRVIEAPLKGAPPRRRYQYEDPSILRQCPDPRVIAARRGRNRDWVEANAPPYVVALTLETVADTALASPAGLVVQGEDLGILLYKYLQVHMRG